MKQRKSEQYLLAFGHFCSDINQTALSALLPFLIVAHHYDYTTAAMLAMGLFLAGGGMAVIGWIPNFYGLCIAVIISGIGIAMFHPQAAKLVNQVATENNRGMSLSIFLLAEVWDLLLVRFCLLVPSLYLE